MSLRTIAVTGAAGGVGSAVRESLCALAERVLLVDRVPVRPRHPAEQVRTVEIADVDSARRALAGADAVLHLAGIPDEAPLPDLLAANVLGTQHVLEAARLDGIGRVVLASSNRLTGWYPAARRIDSALPPRPDGLYGVSKVAVEALGRLYADKFGLAVACLRIGSLEAEPSEPRHLATWLSHRDCAGFVTAALTIPGLGFATAYAVSANTRRFWELDSELGYTPLDDAEVFADRIPDAAAFFAADTPQGGAYAAPDYTLPHLVPTGCRAQAPGQGLRPSSTFR